MFKLRHRLRRKYKTPPRGRIRLAALVAFFLGSLTLLSKAATFVMVSSASTTGDLTGGSTCFMKHTQVGFEGPKACDYSFTSQMRPTNPYPAVASEIDRAFYVQFASVK